MFDRVSKLIVTLAAIGAVAVGASAIASAASGSGSETTATAGRTSRSSAQTTASGPRRPEWLPDQARSRAASRARLRPGSRAI